MTGDDATSVRQADIVRLPTLDPSTRATLHRPTGLRIVSIGDNCVSGSREELLRIAAEIIAADWEAGKPSPSPPGENGRYSTKRKLMTKMRAKMQINRIELIGSAEVLHMAAVAKSTGYPADGGDEDNTFAKFSPQGTLSLTVANPALHGKFAVGEKYYLDFTLAT